MARWNFGLRQLFLWTAAIALGLVALRSATTTWVAGMLGLALAVLTVSILLVIFRRGAQRAFWIGFATVGWMYLLLVGVSWTLARTDSNDTPLQSHNLITQQLASATYHWLYDKAFEKYYATSSAGNYYGPMPGGGYLGTGMPSAGGSGSVMLGGISPYGMNSGPPPGPKPGPNESDFVNVAHSLWTLLVAALGGAIAYWLYQTGPGQSESQVSASP